MRKLIIATGLVLGMASVAGAQSGSEPGSDRTGERAERHAAQLSEKLGLTEAQKLEVEAIFAEQGAARRELHDRYRAERQALKEQAQARLGTVLSAEQMAQLEQMRAERKERWQDRRRGRHGRGAHAGS